MKEREINRYAKRFIEVLSSFGRKDLTKGGLEDEPKARTPSKKPNKILISHYGQLLNIIFHKVGFKLINETTVKGGVLFEEFSLNFLSFRYPLASYKLKFNKEKQ